MSQINRLTDGGRINRHSPIEFKFNGKKFQGFQGDTLASALIANNISVVGRSLKYHRPRGLFAAGSEEPNAILQIGYGPSALPNQIATQIELYNGLEANCDSAWPNLKFDILSGIGLLSRFMPPAFYYKTFMWPKSWWKFYEKIIRKVAGFGSVPNGPDPDHYEKFNAHCDVLVVGGGPAGLSAALEAGKTGARVILADEQQEFGGNLLSTSELIDDMPALEWVCEKVTELKKMPEVIMLSRSTVAGYYDHNFVTVLERLRDHMSYGTYNLPRQRLWRIRAKQIVLATGAIERTLLFNNNDRPGVMLASAVSTYLNRYSVKPGSKAVIFTNNDSAYITALDLTNAGVNVEAIVDLRSNPKGPLPGLLRKNGIPIFREHTIINVKGRTRVKNVQIMALNKSGSAVTGKSHEIVCDLVAVSGGWNPTIHLHTQSGGTLKFDEFHSCFVPLEAVQDEISAGSCNGTFSLDECLKEGSVTGAKAAYKAGFGIGPSVPISTEATESRMFPQRDLWILPSLNQLGRGPKQFIDLQTDTTVADLVIATREGYQSIEHIKRYVTLGMGTDQGKSGNMLGIGVLSRILFKDISSIGTTTFRPPYTPVTYGAIAGRSVGPLFDPVRKTPIHSWHVDNGALFENVGQWKRAWYYPRDGENFQQTINRESTAARTKLAITDASTLGKIDIQGPDAAKFLDRIYTNSWLNLPIGKCKYGLMLREDGMIMDDGVTARLGENHYLMHTTSSNAGIVMNWLERWLQTEWPDFKVYLTSVTDHWATIGLVGPYSRYLVSSLCSDIDFSAESFPFMSFRTGTASGVDLRIFRISFSGELSYEINIPAKYGLSIWKTCIELGKKYDITPYGTETMHVLRAEKGFIIVGQDTDGSVIPKDAGMSWIVNSKRDFIGKRSLSRSDMFRKDRKQLVGLLSHNPIEILPEGSQITEDSGFDRPKSMIGHITSSYYSANLGHSIALALIKEGRSRIDEEVFVFDAQDRCIRAKISSPVFYDSLGERQNV
jgi:sarcosine oxidase subunit alpha